MVAVYYKKYQIGSQQGIVRKLYGSVLSLEGRICCSLEKLKNVLHFIIFMMGDITVLAENLCRMNLNSLLTLYLVECFIRASL
jgi:hypothetical protein